MRNLCETCDGSGGVPAPTPWWSMFRRWARCPDCEGSGKARPTHPKPDAPPPPPPRNFRTAIETPGGTWYPPPTTEPPDAPPPPPPPPDSPPAVQPRKIPAGFRAGSREELDYWLGEPGTKLIPASRLNDDGSEYEALVVFNPAMKQTIERREQMKRRGELPKQATEAP